MSGGSMDYLYAKVEEARFRDDTPLRAAFAAHLKWVARALRAIEWNDSCDGDDGEDEAILACISRSDVLDAAVERAERVLSDLTETIAFARATEVKP
jgi:hypothetical protein